MPRDGYDFWLFDLDGTLVDIEPWYPTAVMGRVGDVLDVAFTDRDAAILWYGMGESRGELLADHGVSPTTFWRTFHEVENPAERAKATYLYDDAVDLVPAIDAPVGLVTHCQRYLADPVFDELDIRDWFDAVVCCSDATGWKPDPAPVRRLMRMLDVDADDGHGVLIGDDAADVGAAQAVGVDAVQVVRPSGPGGVGTPAEDPRAASASGGDGVDGGGDASGGDAIGGGDAIDRLPAADGGDPDDEPRRIASLAELGDPMV